MINPNTLTEEEQINFVQITHCNIECIKEPSEKVQIAAIKRFPGCGYVVRYIHNQTNKAQIEAVKNFYYEGDEDDYDNFVNKYIKYKKAIKLYHKLKSVRKIIK
jgi:hypothetical protein